MEEQNNLPIVDSKKTLSTNNVIFKNILDTSKRVLKIIGGVAGITAGTVLATGASVIGAPAIVSSAIVAGGIITGVKGLSNVVYKKEPSLTFVSKNNHAENTIEIFQDALQYPSYLRGISVMDKANMMGLQTLIGLQRYKVDLRDSGTKTVEKDGKKVYDQNFSTITHSININNLHALEKAGYIKIVAEEEEFNHFPGEKVLGIKKRPSKSLLVMEKIGFSNISGIKQILNAIKSGDSEQLDSLKQTMKKITFQLTDKNFYFEDIYQKINGYKEFDSPEEQDGLRKLRTVFYDSNNRIPGILSGTRYKQPNKGKKRRIS